MRIIEKSLYNTAETAEIMCIKVKTVWKYIHRKKLRALKRGDGNYLVAADDIRVFLGMDPDEPLAPIEMETTNAKPSQGHGPGDSRTTPVDGTTPRP